MFGGVEPDRARRGGWRRTAGRGERGEREFRESPSLPTPPNNNPPKSAGRVGLDLLGDGVRGAGGAPPRTGLRPGGVVPEGREPPARGQRGHPRRRPAQRAPEVEGGSSHPALLPGWIDALKPQSLGAGWERERRPMRLSFWLPGCWNDTLYFARCRSIATTPSTPSASSSALESLSFRFHGNKQRQE